MIRTETVSAPVMMRAAEIRASSYDESDNSVEVVWTTGAAVRRRDWRTGEYFSEVLVVTPKAVRLDRLNAGAPLLDTHNDASLASILGCVVSGSARIEGGKGIARVRLSKAPSDADVVSKIRDGIIRNISVGYKINRVEVVENDGGDDEWRVVDWEPQELSAVAVPADPGAQVRSDGVKDGSACEFVSERKSTAAFAAATRKRMEIRARAAGLEVVPAERERTWPLMRPR